jgi:SET domain-containing protein
MRSGQECIDYLNSTVWATLKKSPIHNVGVFAIRDIPKGTTISDHTHNKTTTLNKLTDEELQKVYPEIRKLILDRMVFLKEDKKLEFFSPNSDAVLQCWMNHSTSPNTTGTRTLRNIKKGEELTEDFKAIAGGPIHPVSASHFKFLHRGSTRKNKK